MPISQLLPIHSPTTLSPKMAANREEIAATDSYAKNEELNQLNSRRRRVASDDAVAFEKPGRRGEILHAEAWPVTWLGFELLGYLCLFYKCILKLVALLCYGLLILPGLVQVGYNYFYSSKIRRSISYGDQPRNKLDLYLPSNDDGSPKPVVALITGGAWIIGHKAWGTLLGQHLSDRGIIVACIDYRNFPQGTMSDMVRDASEGISFVCNNIAKYGGDPNRIYVMGQSAGAHIAACTLLDQAIKESDKKECASWSVLEIKAYFGLSGGYNLLNLVDHFHSRGLLRSIFLRCEFHGEYLKILNLVYLYGFSLELMAFDLISIMEGEESLMKFSPELIVQDPKFKNAASLLPPNVLFHGTGDCSIPSDSSKTFAESLQRVGVKAVSILYDGKTHTDLFVQDPMRGGKDEMFEHLVSFIHGDDSESLARDADVAVRKRLVPELMLQLAHCISPF